MYGINIAKVYRFFYSTLLTFYSVQHWMSTATCAAALELPNLNYNVHGQI